MYRYFIYLVLLTYLICTSFLLKTSSSWSSLVFFKSSRQLLWSNTTLRGDIPFPLRSGSKQGTWRITGFENSCSCLHQTSHLTFFECLFRVTSFVCNQWNVWRYIIVIMMVTLNLLSPQCQLHILFIRMLFLQFVNYILQVILSPLRRHLGSVFQKWFSTILLINGHFTPQ